MEGLNSPKNARERISPSPLSEGARNLLRVALLAAMTSVGTVEAREITPSDEHQTEIRDDRAHEKFKRRNSSSGNFNTVPQKETNEAVDGYIHFASKFLDEFRRIGEAYRQDRAGFEHILELKGTIDEQADERLRREHARKLIAEIFEDVKMVDKAFPPDSAILDVPYKKDPQVRNKVLRTIDNVKELFNEQHIPSKTREAAFLEFYRQGN